MLTGRVVEPNPYLAKGERETETELELAFFFSLFLGASRATVFVCTGDGARDCTCTSYDTAYYRRSNGSVDGSHKSLASYKYVAQAGTEPASSSTSEKGETCQASQPGSTAFACQGVGLVASDRKSRPEFPIQFNFFFHTAGSSR